MNTKTVTVIFSPNAGYYRCFDKQLSIDDVEIIGKEIEKSYQDRGNITDLSIMDDGDIEIRCNETRIYHYYWAVIDVESFPSKPSVINKCREGIYLNNAGHQELCNSNPNNCS